MRLDEDKLEALRSWGERLRKADGAEPAAVGRAILMLIDEIDRLHIELWHATLQRPEAERLPETRRSRLRRASTGDCSEHFGATRTPQPSTPQERQDRARTTIRRRPRRGSTRYAVTSSRNERSAGAAAAIYIPRWPLLLGEQCCAG